MMTSLYSLAPVHVWRDNDHDVLTFEWFGIAPIGVELRELFDMTLELAQTERRRSSAPDRPLDWYFDLRHLLICNSADINWLSLSWLPRVLAAGGPAPVFVLPEGPLRAALHPGGRALRADSYPRAAESFRPDPRDPFAGAPYLFRAA